LLIDLLALRADQEKFDVVMEIAKVSLVLVKLAGVLDVLEPMALTDAYRVKNALRKRARRRQLVEPAYRRDRGLSPGFALFRFLGLVLAAAGVSQPERSDDRRQQQSLTDQCHQDGRVYRISAAGVQ
jgi:hypothetical protein